MQRGKIGACLMAEPQLVADCVSAMRNAVDIPVTVKCRIGIDRNDAYEPFAEFVDAVAEGGCEVFIVHARKAWLDGLSPKENREVPPLRYDMVYRIKQERPDLTIVINGGIDSIAAAQDHLQHVDGVMLGRAAYQRPALLAEVDSMLFGDGRATRLRHEVMHDLRAHAARQLAAGARLKDIVRPILGLYHGQPGGRRFRRVLSERAHADDAGLEVLDAALDAVAQRPTSAAAMTG